MKVALKVFEGPPKSNVISWSELENTIGSVMLLEHRTHIFEQPSLEVKDNKCMLIDVKKIVGTYQVLS